MVHMARVSKVESCASVGLGVSSVSQGMGSMDR